MRADWTVSGACTSGSTALRRDATRPASGGSGTTSTTRIELATHDFRASFSTNFLWHLGAAVRWQHSGDNCLVRVDVGDGRNADAVALPPNRRQNKRGAPRL